MQTASTCSQIHIRFFIRYGDIFLADKGNDAKQKVVGAASPFMTLKAEGQQESSSAGVESQLGLPNFTAADVFQSFTRKWKTSLRLTAKLRTVRVRHAYRCMRA